MCSSRCSGCLRSGKDFPCKHEETICCGDCNRWFYNQDCFDHHKRKTTTTVKTGAKQRKVESSVCTRLWRCKPCGKTIRTKQLRGEDHECGQVYCRVCKRFQEKGHGCYIQPVERKTCEKEPTFIFFDLETRQDEEVGETVLGPVMKHIPNFCAVEKVTGTSVEKKEFKGDNCSEDFCKWLFSRENHGATAIAHNMKGFDGQFVLQYLHQQAIKPSIIPRGQSIMCLEAVGIKAVLFKLCNSSSSSDK